jgi:DNA-binding LytR/AlgR family response regulator
MSNDFLHRLRGPGFAFLYWIVFLLALEPGNVLHAKSMGRTLEFDIEALRICVAALLGTSSAPLLIALARRFPIAGSRRARSIAIHAAGAVGISFGLIVVSCFLAAWVLMAKPLPSMPEIRGQLAANWLLLTFALGAFSMLGHVLKLFPQGGPKAIPIKTRGRLGHLDLASVEWIESQGNYLALHAGGKSHLIRETLQGFSRRIDPARFIRVHRRMIVDIHRVREIQPLANGDSTLILRDGQMIRASRNYREAVRKRWAEVMAQR